MANENEDGFFAQVEAMAERLGLTGDDRQKYVHEHMTRGGYRMVPSYVKDDDEGDTGGSDFFGNRKRNKGNQGNSGGNRGDSGGKSGGWF
jgi:hypothetical protein